MPTQKSHLKPVASHTANLYPKPRNNPDRGAWSYQYAGTANDGTTYDSAAAPTKAGSYTVTATFENDTHIGSKTFNLTIAPKNISITGVTAASREYDGTTDVVIIGGTLNGIVGTDAVTPAVPAMGTIVDANAGNNKAVTLGTITLAGTDKDNYTLTQPAASPSTLHRRLSPSRSKPLQTSSIPALGLHLSQRSRTAVLRWQRILTTRLAMAPT
jgi:PKD repeat protein